ncbi:hypothetical protein L5515_006482 [Caenorhabditis briggsae]|uniref:Uncharacterized protein n=1 Tax=Caenorhabditis briggsae TaxID=6238 RepID=A0AAE9F0U7_CAEBR|nr:hypothetical protein L5515_006482 [Caenorhabditis briggsae]
MTNIHTLNDLKKGSGASKTGVGRKIANSGNGTETLTITHEDLKNAGLRQCIEILGGMDEIVAVMQAITEYVRFPDGIDSTISLEILQEMIDVYNRASSMQKGAAKSKELIKLINLYKEFLKESRADYRNHNWVINSQLTICKKENETVKNENDKLKKKLKEAGKPVDVDKNNEVLKLALDQANKETAELALQYKKRKVRTTAKDLFR